jgi:hypothetical protein
MDSKSAKAMQRRALAVKLICECALPGDLFEKKSAVRFWKEVCPGTEAPSRFVVHGSSLDEHVRVAKAQDLETLEADETLQPMADGYSAGQPGAFGAEKVNPTEPVLMDECESESPGDGACGPGLCFECESEDEAPRDGAWVTGRCWCW